MQQITKERLTSLETVAKASATRASEVLSKLIGLSVKLEVLRTRIEETEHFASLVVSPKESVSAVVLPIIGEGRGSGTFISSVQESYRLAELVTKLPKGSLTKLDDLATSALKETANIIGGAFLSVFSDTTGISFIQSVPELHVDTMKKVVDVAIATLRHEGSEASVAFEIDFKLSAAVTNETIIAQYIFFLELAFAQKLLGALEKK